MDYAMLQHGMNKTVEYNKAWLEKLFPGVNLSTIVEVIVEHGAYASVFSYDTNQYVDELRVKVILKSAYGGTLETVGKVVNGEVHPVDDTEQFPIYMDLSPLTVANTKTFVGSMKATQQWMKEDNEKLKEIRTKKKAAPKQTPKVDPFTPGGRKLNLPKPTEN